MSAHAKPIDLDSELKRTTRAQSDAADPLASAWVSANAGTGKTHVLTRRVIRLLLAGTPPERILCLTYTKAAAAEMSKRVFDELAKWVTASPDDLKSALVKLLEREPTDDELARARILFAASIETPGGLKVQTIHAFCERLLQRFPLEAGVPPGFSILDDETGRALQREAVDDVLHAATRDRNSPLGQALAIAIAYAVDDRFDDLLAQAIRQRSWLDALLRFDGGIAEVEDLLRRKFGVRAGATRQAIERDIATLIPEPDLRRLRDALSGGSSSDVKLAATVTGALDATSPAARAKALLGYLLNGDGEPRKRPMTNGIKAAHPDLDAIVQRAQSRAPALRAELGGIRLIEATIALYRLADAVLQNFKEAKARRAVLDYDDLILKTAGLLNPRGYNEASTATEWVLFKLDGGLDHILVDEAQDTSPEQWRVIEALATEFFTGAGAREERRTLFAVGDEKQSIYSFQGADPRKFAEMGDAFSRLAQGSEQVWRRVPLDLSFRTVRTVLDAVDGVFSDAARTPGVTAGDTSIRHIASRLGHAGLVEIWPTEKPDDPSDIDTWQPLDETPDVSPVTRLADRIAATIERWLQDGERLPSEDRPVRAGDILILVRKRRPFAPAMVAALKARKIPVAGADRLALTEQIAIMDMMALGDFLTLPEDDLSLATVLKSPLFDLDDNDLLTIASGRKGTLWKALLDHRDTDPRYRAAGDTLKAWRARADYAPPYEFFAGLLGKDGGRARMLARLGGEASDALDEFLDLALSYDDAAPPSLTGFLSWLRASEREVKRDMEHGRNEVRVLTVHGAKGLEAPIVFLPDTCTTASAARQAGGIVTLEFDGDTDEKPLGTPPPFVWCVKGASKLPPMATASAATAQAETAERNRLLYVAMTRARDRLYVAGFETRSGRAPGCWYDLICEGLAGTLAEVPQPDGTTLLRLSEEQTAEPKPPRHELAASMAPVPLPEWALRPAPRVNAPSIPLAPSRLEAYAPDDEGEPLPNQPGRDIRTDEPPAAPSASLGGDFRFLRGTLTHALLQHLPTLPSASWQSAAAQFIAKRGAALSPRAQASIISETLTILNDPSFAPLFGPTSRPEVPIAALIPRPDGKGPPLRLSGQIDRLVETAGEVLIVDYKTNRPPPREPEQVALAYIYQLVAYRLALQEIYPGRTIRAALLWTDGPRLMEIPPRLLDTATSQLWDLEAARLDAPVERSYLPK
jgi:ATP-dependent helicase/nuclease subunit A